METAHDFLTNLALVLCVAGVTTLIFQRLHQPVVFGYLLAGLIIGPHTAVPLVANEDITLTLAETGVILLMFSLGLEFRLRKLVQVGPTAGIIGLVQCVGMVWLGYAVGRLLGWTTIESIYAGCIIAISSTTIIIKAFAEQSIRARYTRLVFGILIVEDLIAIFMLTLLTAVSAGQGVTAGTIGATALGLGLFLAALIGIGILLVPRLIRAVLKLENPETTLVTTVGICFACALLALEFGYSVALGAFIGGSLVAESGHSKALEHLVQPVRDMFGAIFFVAVGMLIEPRLIAQNIGPVLLLTAAVIVGKVGFVALGAFATGQGVKTSVQSGMSLAQIGEFSFIIAALGLSLNATRDFLYPVAVAVSALTTLTTPLLIKHSSPVASWVDRKLPRALQTYVALYGSWIDRLRLIPEAHVHQKRERRILLLALDWLLLLALVVGTAIKLDTWTARLAQLANLAPVAAHWLIVAIAALAGAPLCLGILRITRSLSHDLAAHALPEQPSGQVDLAAAPRNAFEVTIQLLMVLIIGGLTVIITQPFIPPFRSTAIFALVMVALGLALWRSASNLQGHTRAGAEIFALALSRQMTDDEDVEGAVDMAKLKTALPGLGEPVAVRIGADSKVIGRSLRQLDLRGSTGAMVLAIVRADGTEVVLPDGHEQISAGDTLFIAGAQRAVSAARTLL